MLPCGTSDRFPVACSHVLRDAHTKVNENGCSSCLVRSSLPACRRASARRLLFTEAALRRLFRGCRRRPLLSALLPFSDCRPSFWAVKSVDLCTPSHLA